ncbi:Jerky -like [Araneus ventricosus]|uniref:Jerky-like n=1 Tax=Araneus ventricosus TaxID=182803 RepID=A0A4Y2S7E6_ARAVE|nr:Jerky -like [Araneus ventricosus]
MLLQAESDGKPYGHLAAIAARHATQTVKRHERRHSGEVAVTNQHRLKSVRGGAEGIPISGAICSEKARIFHEALGLEGDFNASSGWLIRFKQRHGIRQLNVEGERLSADVTAADSFCVKFQEFIDEENLIPNQIYNADETGLYWKCLPTKTLASREEKSAPGHKSSKRITIM